MGGEGLQHQDGSSHLIAGTIPNCKAYDPAFAGELAIIIERGMQEMMVEQKDVFYYITLMNENYTQPDIPEDVKEQIIRGAYIFKKTVSSTKKKHQAVTLLGSGAIMTEVIKAADLLAQHGVSSTILSVTSWSELFRDGRIKFSASGHCLDSSSLPHITAQLLKTQGPIIAATDYVHAVPESIRAYLPEQRKYITLGTDGFGRSDTREALRQYFGVDAKSIVQTALKALH